MLQYILLFSMKGYCFNAKLCFSQVKFTNCFILATIKKKKKSEQLQFQDKTEWAIPFFLEI